MNKNIRLGFSLIELSIVILVIGILVIGITQGSRIISASKLRSARALTASSPVNSIEGLALWLETTSEQSFDSNETVNQGTVTNWYDINQSNFNHIDVSQTTTASKPKYLTSGGNGLPVLSFDGTDDWMQKTAVSGSQLSNSGNQITIFIVQKYYSPAKNCSVIWWSIDATRRINFHAPHGNSGGTFFFDFGDINNGRVSFAAPQTYYNKFNIITAIRRPNNTGEVRINGTQYVSSSSLTANLDIGQIQDLNISRDAGNVTGYQKGDIGEIIIFRNGIKTSEVQAIEQYLSAKWGVALKGL